MHVLDRHAPLEGLNSGYRAVAPAFLRGAAIDDARFVEMDVALDQPGAGEAPFGIVNLPLGSESWLNCCDTTIFHADIDRRALRPVGKTCVPDNEVHASAPISPLE